MLHALIRQACKCWKEKTTRRFHFGGLRRKYHAVCVFQQYKDRGAHQNKVKKQINTSQKKKKSKRKREVNQQQLGFDCEKFLIAWVCESIIESVDFAYRKAPLKGSGFIPLHPATFASLRLTPPPHKKFDANLERESVCVCVWQPLSVCVPFRTLLLFEGSFVGLFASASNFFFLFGRVFLLFYFVFFFLFSLIVLLNWVWLFVSVVTVRFFGELYAIWRQWWRARPESGHGSRWSDQLHVIRCVSVFFVFICATAAAAAAGV